MLKIDNPKYDSDYLIKKKKKNLEAKHFLNDEKNCEYLVVYF